MSSGRSGFKFKADEGSPFVLALDGNDGFVHADEAVRSHSRGEDEQVCVDESVLRHLRNSSV